MAVKGEWVSYGEGSGYYAAPERAQGPLPGVLVIQEVFGVNEHIQDVTRRIAAAGYAALAPDLFAVNGARPAALREERIAEAMRFAGSLPPGAMFDPARRDAALSALPPAEASRILESFQEAFSFVAPARQQALMAPLGRSFRYLREERPETKGQKIGCVGFCMGGGLSALLACEEPALSAAAVFYGMAPAAEKVSAVTCPLIAFYGALDQRVNAGIPGFQDSMKKARKSFTHFVYDGAGHSFFNDDSPAYNVKAARDAFHKLLAFFSNTLAV
jgi:carboxymethylenebutenolidase